MGVKIEGKKMVGRREGEGRREKGGRKDIKEGSEGGREGGREGMNVPSPGTEPLRARARAGGPCSPPVDER